jgi:hypothetical protein
VYKINQGDVYDKGKSSRIRDQERKTILDKRMGLENASGKRLGKD